MKTLFSKITLLLTLLSLSVSNVWAYWTTDRDGNTQADNASIKGYVSKSSSTYYVLDDAKERSISLSLLGEHVEHNYNINGPAAILTFEAKRSRWSARNLVVAQRIIGGGWSDVYDKNPGTSYEGSGNISLDEKAVELSFYNNYGSGTRYFENVKVTMASYCTPATTSISFGSDTYLSSDNKTLKVYWSNMSPQTITKSGDTDRFTVSLNSIPSKAGYYGNTVVTITYNRDAVGSHTMKLKINGQTVTVTGTTTQATPTITSCATASEIAYNTLISTSSLTPGTAVHPTKGTAIDGTWTWQTPTLTADCHETYIVVFTPDAKYSDGYSTQTCSISIPITKLDQTISWGLTENVEYATGTLMNATASSERAVTYSSSNDAYGYINENNRLVVVVPNQTITITAHQAGDCNWNAAPDVTKTIITLGANPNQFMDVEATSITYGDLLGESKFTPESKVYVDGVEIDGTLEWVDPKIMPNAGTANHMVLFTPDNEAAYSSVYFEVPVTVAKANPVITWNIGSILREEVRYDHFVESSNKENTFAVTVSNSTLLNVSGTTLRTDSVDNKVTGLTITVTQAASDNYNYKTETKTVAIYPKAGICLPFNPMTESDFGEAMKATDGGSWCNTNANGSDTYALVTITYTQRVGIELGNWRGGFDYSTKYVDLFFSGIPDQISFDYEGQNVHSPGIDWPATAVNLYLYESADDVTYTECEHQTNNSGTITYSLNENTRYIRIAYTGNFAVFIKNLRITQKKYLREKDNKTELVFGTETHPLQAPQALTLSYSSLGVCGGTDDNITVTSSNPAFYVDETTITENVGIELKGEYVVRVRCNDVNQSGTLTFESNDGTTLNISVRSTNPAITTAATSIFETGTEYASVSASYRALRTHDFSDCFDGAQAKFDTLYIYGVSESSAADRQWIYDASKGYKVPAVSASNVHTPCFVYYKDGAQYTYARTFDASTTTLNVADSKTRVFVGYRPEGPAATAIQVNGANTELYLNNTEIIASGAPLAINATSAVYANGVNIISSTDNAAVQLSGATTLTVEDTWTGDATSAILALRPAASYPSIDLGSASGRVDVNGTQLTLRNATNMAIAHMEGTTEHFDGEVHINDGSVGGEATLGMPKRTFIDGGTFNDGTVAAYTLKGMPKRPRNSRGDMLSRHTMSKDALASAYSWYGQAHLTQDGASKVNPMLMDEQVCIFEGFKNEDGKDAANWTKWPTADDDVLINAPMVIAGAEMTVKSLTINWVRGEHGQPAVTVAPDGGLTVGEGGVDGAVKDNLLLKAGTEGATKGQTGFLRIHPEPNSWELMPQANVELFSIGYYDIESEEENIAAWQYVGVPVETSALAKTFFKKSWIYSWNEEVGDWQNKRVSLVMAPFEGYATTQDKFAEGALISFTGTLLDGKEYKRPLTANGTTIDKGMNVLANSFTAPIDMAQFSTEDFSEGVDPTIYIFNTGSRTDAHQTVDIAEKAEAKGQYLAVPVNNVDAMKAAYKYPTVIAPMQGFCIKTEKEGTVTLNYERLVWNGNYSEHPNTPLRTPKKAVNLSTLGSLCVTISANGWSDNLYMLESESYDKAYEAGYDAIKMNSGEFNVFAVEGESRLAVDATNNIIGTYVGVRTGEETTYTLSFSHLMTNNELFLLDKETNEIVDIYDGVEYTFYAEPNSEITDRFQISGREKTPEVTTAIEEAAENNGARVHKFIKDNQLYILKNGVLYNATGARVH